MKIVNVDLDKCEGHGKCYMVAGELFDFADDHGRAKFVGDPMGPDDTEALEQAERAVNSCPEEALTLVEQDDPGETA